MAKKKNGEGAEIPINYHLESLLILNTISTRTVDRAFTVWHFDDCNVAPTFFPRILMRHGLIAGGTGGRSNMFWDNNS